MQGSAVSDWLRHAILTDIARGGAMGRKADEYRAHLEDKDYLPSAHGGICTVMDAAGRPIATIDPKTRVRTKVKAQPTPSGGNPPEGPYWVRNAGTSGTTGVFSGAEGDGPQC